MLCLDYVYVYSEQCRLLELSHTYTVTHSILLYSVVLFRRPRVVCFCLMYLLESGFVMLLGRCSADVRRLMSVSP